MVACAKANGLGPHFRTPALKRLSPPYPQVPSIIHYETLKTPNPASARSARKIMSISVCMGVGVGVANA